MTNQSTEEVHSNNETLETGSRCGWSLAGWLSSLNPLDLVAGFIFASLVTLGAFDKGVVGNWVVMVLLGFSAMVYLFVQGRGFKEIFFYAHIEEKSRFAALRYGFWLVLLFALVGGLFLSLSLWVFLLTTHWFILLAAVLVQFLFFPVRKGLKSWIDPHLKPLSQMVAANAATVVVLGVLTTIVLVFGRLCELLWITDRTLLVDVHAMASHVIDRMEYSIPVLQHLSRTLLMFELEILRAHSFAEGWFGHLILIYFLLPSTVAAFALPVVQGGISMLCSGTSLSRPMPEKQDQEIGRAIDEQNS